MIPCHENVDTNIVSKVFVLYTGGTIGMTRNKDDILVGNYKGYQCNDTYMLGSC